MQLFDVLPRHIEDALRASIERFGVLVPITMDQHGEVLDGHHRQRIAKELGVPYDRLVRECADEDERREIARTLNADRRQLTEEQRRSVVVDLRKQGHSERAIAGALGVSKATVHRDVEREQIGSSEPISPDRVLRQGGGSYPARRPQVIARDDREQAKAQSALPALAADPAEATRTTSEAVRVAARQRQPEPAISQPLPDGVFRCIVLDPPWPMDKIEREVAPEQGVKLDYPTMTLDEIGALPIADLADPAGCHIYLWVTHKFLPAGLDLFGQWGARYQCLMTWRKNVGFTPFSWMYDTEHVLFGRIGSLKLERLGLRLSFDAPVTRHSAKPDVFYERVTEASPGPRLEMFARQPRAGFAVWGNEVTDELAG